MSSKGSGVVLGLPRGGVPVAAEISLRLGWPLDVIVVRKIGFPGQPQLAMGAVASGGIVIKNQSVLDDGNVDVATFRRRAASTAAEVVEMEALLRDGPSIPINRQTVVVVDDGLATGSTMKAALEAVRSQQPSSVIAAVPVAARDTFDEIETIADEVVCLLVPEHFVAVGLWYRSFPQVSTAEVRHLLQEFRPNSFNT